VASRGNPGATGESLAKSDNWETPSMAGAGTFGRRLARALRSLRRAARVLEAAQVRRFGRSAVSVLFRTPVLVLETTGRRVPVFHLVPEGDGRQAPA
jgi:hypothetical protein